MPISHIFAEGVGPFKQIHLDLTGPDGKASLGPHIFAGVNGSGKSTLLKAIAWCLATSGDEFPVDDWLQLLRGYSVSRVLLLFDMGDGTPFAWAATSETENDWKDRLTEWVTGNITAAGLPPNKFPFSRERPSTLSGEDPFRPYVFRRARFGQMVKNTALTTTNVAAYSSVRSLRYIERPDMAGLQKSGQAKRFSFDSTIQNEAIQSWLLSLYSKQAIAKERHQSSSRYTASLQALERGMKHVCGDDVSVAVDIEPNFQPGLRIGNKTLNFSQLPDGIKAILGLLADFLMRSETQDWVPEFEIQRPGILLFDEIEGYLHPLWQRRILPALVEALPHTQILVTSHSPFVISSCPESFVHVLKTNSDGSAYVEPPVKAPIGESITSTLKEIFGVDSRFDIKTELELDEWNKLHKARHKLQPKDLARFEELSRTLASRSEELRSLVTPVPKLSRATVDKLTEVANGGHSRKRSTAPR